jgi:hypothetical protein
MHFFLVSLFINAHRMSMEINFPSSLKKKGLFSLICIVNLYVILNEKKRKLFLHKVERERSKKNCTISEAFFYHLSLCHSRPTFPSSHTIRAFRLKAKHEASNLLNLTTFT